MEYMEPDVILLRTNYATNGTFGFIKVGGQKLYTVERPWLNNAINFSCIPEGSYVCREYSSKKYPKTFEVTNVPGRTYILFHAANYPEDVRGCIGLGLELTPKVGVLRSREAMAVFKKAMIFVDHFTLKITSEQRGIENGN